MEKQEKSSFLKDYIERVKSGKKSPESIRKRRLSRIILVIDIIIVITVLIIFNRNSNEPVYHSTSLSVNDIYYRASITREKESGIYLFSFVIKSESKKEKTLYFNESIAKLDLKYKMNTIYTTIIGDNLQKLKILPGEVKTFVSEINDSVIRQFASEHADVIIPRKKTLFHVKRYIPLSGIITINTKEKVLARIDFNYMVE